MNPENVGEVLSESASYPNAVCRQVKRAKAIEDLETLVGESSAMLPPAGDAWKAQQPRSLVRWLQRRWLRRTRIRTLCEILYSFPSSAVISVDCQPRMAHDVARPESLADLLPSNVVTSAR